MKATPDPTLAIVVVFVFGALGLLGLVMLGAPPAALSGVAAVVAAIGLAVGRLQRR